MSTHHTYLVTMKADDRYDRDDSNEPDYEPDEDIYADEAKLRQVMNEALSDHGIEITDLRFEM